MDTKGARYHRLEKGVRGVIIGGKKFIGYFHVSEHIDHFKAIKSSVKKPPCLVKNQTISGFFI